MALHTTNQQQAGVTPQLLSAAQVAIITGKGISTVWRDVKTGDLPKPIKVGNSTRWRIKDINQWLAQFDAEMEGA